jgi:thiamine kinase
VSKNLLAENAVNNWQQWDTRLRNRPVILGPLIGGRSNRSFLLDSDIGKLVLRLNASDSILPGSTRHYESMIWQAASDEGIAPRLLHHDNQQGLLVSIFIHNHLPEQPTLCPALYDQLFGLLGRCHQLQVESPTIDYASHIERYWNDIENSNTPANLSLIEQRQPMRLLLDALITSGTKTGLCHHDPVIANFVGNAERLYLIDWEYATHGFLVMDYAAICIEWKIDDTEITLRTGIEQELLVMAKTLYRYICELWEEQKKPRG